jgi:hypothetical protein
MPVGPVAPTIAIFVMTGINAEHCRAYPKLGPNDPQSPYKPILRRINDGVRFESKADIAASPTNVRFTPKSRHSVGQLGCPLSARSRYRVIHYSITSSALLGMTH